MIDLCVVHYNTPDKLEKMFRVLRNSAPEMDYDLFTLYVVDNGPDSTRDQVREVCDRWFHKGLKIELRDFHENLGYAGGCNRLAAMGEGEIIGLLNADIWFTLSDIFSIQKSFNQDPAMAIMGPKQRDEKGLIRHAGIVGSNTAPRHRGWQQHDPHDLEFRDKIECVTVSGSAYFIRRDVWNDLWNDTGYRFLYPDAEGAFLPTPHYYEETWVSYFARHKGHKLCYDGRISIGHSWHASHESGSQQDKQFRVSQEIFRKACDYFEIPRD